ncbi:hypothetical protein IMY05_C4755000700 [Salix suchowensis]|nr:hypothetical protein IMY05_C4755000700 [Salix suchowensis]
MKRLLQEEHNLAFDGKACTQRRSQRFRRKRFWAAGIMDMLCCDQHDKWKRFGLRLHNAVDHLLGRSIGLKFGTPTATPYIPLIAQSDPGSENFGIAKAHTFLWHWHDPDMNGYLCHRWMKEKKNIPPEISWSQLRRGSLLDSKIFLIKVKVQAEGLQKQERYMHHQITGLHIVPLSFENIIHQGYRGMGSPTITRDNVWETYHALVRYIYAELESRNTLKTGRMTRNGRRGGGHWDQSDGSFYHEASTGEGLGERVQKNPWACITEHPLRYQSSPQLDTMVDEDEPLGSNDFWVEDRNQSV